MIERQLPKVLKTKPDRACPWCGKGGLAHCMVSKMPCDVKNCGIQYMLKKEITRNAVQRPKREKVQQERKEG